MGFSTMLALISLLLDCNLLVVRSAYLFQTLIFAAEFKQCIFPQDPDGLSGSQVRTGKLMPMHKAEGAAQRWQSYCVNKDIIFLRQLSFKSGKVPLLMQQKEQDFFFISYWAEEKGNCYLTETQEKLTEEDFWQPAVNIFSSNPHFHSENLYVADTFQIWALWELRGFLKNGIIGRKHDKTKFQWSFASAAVIPQGSTTMCPSKGCWASVNIKIIWAFFYKNI